MSPLPSLVRHLSALLIACLITTALAVTITARPAAAQTPAEDFNRRLGVGINLGAALEAPREGDWGLTLEADHFRQIREAGFRHVRLPVRWSAYAAEQAPYTIGDAPDPTVPNARNIWERVDWAIEQATANRLMVILDLHHYEELHEDPAAHRDRFLAIWDQVAQRYAGQPGRVAFELLNEPQGRFSEDPEQLNTLLADAIQVVRSSNPERTLIVGPAAFNGIEALDALVLPNDPNLIVSVHYYEPFEFTHQGAGWVSPVPPVGARWSRLTEGLSDGWQNWSWDTTVTPAVGGLAIDFGGQWAGFQIARSDAIDPSRLVLHASGSGRVSLRCGSVAGEDVILRSFTLGSEVTRLASSARRCPTDTSRISLLAETPGTEVFLDRAVWCREEAGCSRIIDTAVRQIRLDFSAAAAWGEANGRPMHLGEFGAFNAAGAADLSDRADWTRVVRAVARRNGFAVSYWDFASGFGVFDQRTGLWNVELLGALGRPT